MPAYVPVVRGGGKMHVRMLCLGRHWNGKTYAYEPTRSDFDGQPVPPLPEEFAALARELAAAVGMSVDADLCILNYYDADGRMGLHQDKDEGARSIAAGVPVVSVSLGDAARFLFGGTRRRDPVEALRLESGDGFVFGGPGAAAVSRRLAHSARHRTARSRDQRPVQSHVQAIRPLTKLVRSVRLQRTVTVRYRFAREHVGELASLRRTEAALRTIHSRFCSSRSVNERRRGENCETAAYK